MSRSQQDERLQGRSRPRCRYAKIEDGEFLQLIRSLVDERPTYGYQRIGALLNRQRTAQGLPRLNHKRIRRLMAQNGMLLERHTGKPPGRPHEGQIITIRPNLRWTSAGFGGEMIRDLMIESVECRVNGVAHTPQPIEWLSDNGSCYRAHETQRFAHELGLVPCFTPVRSPESNGMAEACVKSFKLEYVFVHSHPDAKTVLAQLPG